MDLPPAVCPGSLGRDPMRKVEPGVDRHRSSRKIIKPWRWLWESWKPPGWLLARHAWKFCCACLTLGAREENPQPSNRLRDKLYTWRKPKECPPARHMLTAS